MSARRVLAIGLALGLAAHAAWAQTPAARPLRLVGEASGMADPGPKTFVIDALVTAGDSDTQSSIEGWLAATAEPAASGEVTGSCVEQHCTITADLDESKLTLTGDFGAPAGPVTARFTLKDSDDKSLGTGSATLRPLSGPIGDLGPLADPGAVSAAQLDELLMWSQQSVSSGSAPDPDDPPSSFQRETLATWQNDKGRLATGLIFVADLDQLRADEAAARRTAGWTVLGDAEHGWSGGYPAAQLPNATRKGAERRFASADGKAVLVVAIDPPMSDDAFDAFVDKMSSDAGRDEVSNTRVNGDLEVRYRERGVVTVAAFHNREGGLARLVFTYPAAREADLSPYDAILQRSFVATDDLKR
jgi:hypothetical protein